LNKFQTSRLTIRELINNDLEDLSLVLSDPKIMHYSTVGVHTQAQLQEYIHRSTKQYKSKDYGRWGIFTTLNSEFIGLCGLTMEEDSVVHINYRLASKSHGNGYATETVNGLIEYAKNNLKIESISALIEPENVSSINVVLRSGFTMKEESTFKGFSVNVYQIQV
jgi:ribosomal-protein-alanine N-acetyltransferase